MKIRDILGGKHTRHIRRGSRIKRLRQEDLHLKEGGNIFPNSVSFDHEMIPDIMKSINNVLSSTGAKALPIGSGATPTPGKVSGDLDVIVDVDQLKQHFSMEDAKDGDVRKKLRQLFDLAGLNTAQSGVSVHVEVPMGDHSHQVDIMVVPNAANVATFHTHAIPQGSKFKGVNKQLAMSWLAKQKGLKWSAFKGLLNREDNSMVSTDINEIAKLLIGPNASASDLGSVEAISAALPDKGAQMMADLKADPNWKELP